MKKKRDMLIVYGKFDEIEEKYVEPFKAQIENYESSLKHTEISEERKKIKNEFIEITESSMFYYPINRVSELLIQRAKQIRQEHKKEISQDKRMIKKARTLEKAGRLFQSKTLLEKALKTYEEVRDNRMSLKQKIDFDWQQHEDSSKGMFKNLQSFLGEMIEEVVIMERMYESQESNRQTNEELESVLGEKVLGDALQDKNGIGNVFRRLLSDSTKEKGENR